MVRIRIALCIVFLAIVGCSASASTLYFLNLPGIGNQIPVQSYSFPDSTSLDVTRPVDAFSVSLFAAAVGGIPFPTGSFDTYDTLISLTNPVSSFQMTNILITSISPLGPFNNIPYEKVSLTYQTGAQVPEPSSLMLLGSGMAVVFRSVRRKFSH